MLFFNFLQVFSIKLLFFFLIIFMIYFMITGCLKCNVLLILNWGEYINDEIVENFEKEFNCEVKISIADSNELFYAKVKSGTTKS